MTMTMTKLPLAVPIAIFAAGCIICVFAGLGAFSTAVDTAITQAMFKIGSVIGLAGGVLTLVIFYLYKLKDHQSGL